MKDATQLLCRLSLLQQASYVIYLPLALLLYHSGRRSYSAVGNVRLRASKPRSITWRRQSGCDLCSHFGTRILWSACLQAIRTATRKTAGAWIARLAIPRPLPAEIMGPPLIQHFVDGIGAHYLPGRNGKLCTSLHLADSSQFSCTCLSTGSALRG